MAGEDYSRAIVSKLVLIIAILREPLQVEIISEQLLIVYWGLLIYVRMLTPVFLSKNLSLERKITTNLNS